MDYKTKIDAAAETTTQTTNLDSLSEFRCIEVGRALNHSENKILKVSSELRLQILG